MTDASLDDLLNDAKRVAGYGRVSGRLGDDKLFVAIRKAAARTPLGWGDAEAAELQSALSDAVKAIQPVTLIDLRSGWSPFESHDRKIRFRTEAKRTCVVLVTTLLMFVCVYYTSWYRSATALLKELDTVGIEQQVEVVNDIIARLPRDHSDVWAKELDDPTNLSGLALRERIDKARRIDQVLIAQANQSQELYIKLNMLRAVIGDGLSLPSVAPSAHAGLVAGATTAMGQGARDEAGLKPSKPAATALSQTPYSPSSFCIQQWTAENAAADTAADFTGKLAASIKKGDVLREHIRCLMGLRTPGTGDDTTNSNRSYLRHGVEHLSNWALPSLYGALGALMFYMRAFLSPFQRDPSLNRVLLRVSLGVFAGIAITWFWSPEVEDRIGPSEVSIGVLTAAFLVGFSIDIFFALLDRLVTFATNAIGRLGTPSTGAA